MGVVIWGLVYGDVIGGSYILGWLYGVVIGVFIGGLLYGVRVIGQTKIIN